MNRVHALPPKKDRVKEDLEYSSLDSLRMVGSFNKDDVTWAFVRDSGGTVHRVTVDNYLGQNHGRILTVRDDAVELLEIIDNGHGGWMERRSKIALSEKQG